MCFRLDQTRHCEGTANQHCDSWSFLLGRRCGFRFYEYDPMSNGVGTTSTNRCAASQGVTINTQRPSRYERFQSPRTYHTKIMYSTVPITIPCSLLCRNTYGTVDLTAPCRLQYHGCYSTVRPTVPYMWIAKMWRRL
jgi:hypothetical protein